MNRKYLLDSLDGLKGLVFRLLPSEVVASIGCVPMTTDDQCGPWTDEEKTLYETAIGIPRERVYWSPGGIENVPSSAERAGRSGWVDAVAAIKQKYLFLDPDIGFFTIPGRGRVLVEELKRILRGREALIVYRHKYFPKPTPNNIPECVYPYVWHSLIILLDAFSAKFAYQSQAASLFFVAEQKTALAPLQNGLRRALAGVSDCVVKSRIVG